VAGRDFHEAMSTDATAMLVNETAVKHFEFSSASAALGKHVFMGNREFHIIGVVNNYHHLSLKEAIPPILYFPGSTRRPVYSIKVSTDDLPATIAAIRQTWEEVYPDNVFSYFFLDEFFNHQYQTDQQFGAISGLFTVLALLIACLGLFGLASYTTVRRTKEIGIRKVLGASIANILALLSRQYIQLIIIALLIAIPIANYFISDWLENFAYRIEVKWWMYAIPFALVLLIALLSVSGQTVKAARKNPVDSLRYE
jgi:putative ABC transport system permease protein